MAKKTVASLQKGEGRTYSKVIKMVKSPKTGAYTFQESMVPNDAVKDALKYRSAVRLPTKTQETAADWLIVTHARGKHSLCSITSANLRMTATKPRAELAASCKMLS